MLWCCCSRVNAIFEVLTTQNLKRCLLSLHALRMDDIQLWRDTALAPGQSHIAPEPARRQSSAGRQRSTRARHSTAARHSAGVRHSTAARHSAAAQHSAAARRSAGTRHSTGLSGRKPRFLGSLLMEIQKGKNLESTGRFFLKVENRSD